MSKRKTKLPFNEDCAICVSPLRASLLAMRELGATGDDILAASGIAGLTLTEMESHFSNCIPVIDTKAIEDALGGSDADLQKLLVDSIELYHSSVLCGQNTAASSALGVRQRVLVEQGRRAEIRAERKALIAGADPRDQRTWDESLKNFMLRVIDYAVADHREMVAKNERAAREAVFLVESTQRERVC